MFAHITAGNVFTDFEIAYPTSKKLCMLISGTWTSNISIKMKTPNTTTAVLASTVTPSDERFYTDEFAGPCTLSIGVETADFQGGDDFYIDAWQVAL